MYTVHTSRGHVLRHNRQHVSTTCLIVKIVREGRILEGRWKIHYEEDVFWQQLQQ